MVLKLDSFIASHMRQRGRIVPARIQAALALLERLRDSPTLRLGVHKSPNSSGLKSHETFGNRVHERLGLEIVNKNHGRRSCDIGGWGQDLLDRLKDAGFEKLTGTRQSALLDEAQGVFAALIRGLLEEEPLEARLRGRSAEAVFQDILKQADAKGKAGDVAQYLVGAKLMLRLERDIPVVGSNLGDRRSRRDADARPGDFLIENAVLEVAVGPPDEKHLSQVAEALDNTDLEVWLLTRHDRVASWRHELNEYEGVDARRVVVAAVESFVGQNITEMGEFSARGRAARLQELFRLYNERWIAQVGTPGMRIVMR
jgi:hypothetical protein